MKPEPFEVRSARATDLPQVERLVEAAGLMREGLRDAFPQGFVVAESKERLLGCAGVESHGGAGLLRSVVVATDARGTGVGRLLVSEAVQRARTAQLSALYLLTTTAPSFFRHLGFGPLERGAAPAAVQAAPEFTAERCQGATCMWLPLAPGVGPGRSLKVGAVERDALGACLLAHLRMPGEPQVAPGERDLPGVGPAHLSTPAEAQVVLGPRERALLGEMPWPLRRAEWLAGRAVAKALLAEAFGLEPGRTEVLPQESGAPAVHVDGVERVDLVLSLSHTHLYAVAAAAAGPVGVDVCDDLDGPRLSRIARRVFSEGEAEAIGAHDTAQRQAAVWALKEAGLKLRIGGVFDPGARSVRVTSLAPARVADGTMRVELFRLPHGAVAVAR